MSIKKIVLGLVIISAIGYKVLNTKIGPCSPEREIELNKE